MPPDDLAGRGNDRSRRETMLHAIRADFPEITVDRSRVFDSGWDNDAIEINDTLIFRFPKSADGYPEVEVDVLRHLDGKTTLPIPRIEFIGRAERYFGYRKILGSDLTPELFISLQASQRERLARDVAQFLFELHRAMSVEEATRLRVPVDDPESYLREAATAVSMIADSAVAEFVAAMSDEYAGHVATAGPRSFLHNDLHGDNMAFDAPAARLNGVFDFGDIAIGDLHRDFSPLYTVHRELLAAVVREYERLSSATLDLRRIVVYQRVERATDLVLLGNDPGNPEVERAMRHLRLWMDERDLYRS